MNLNPLSHFLSATTLALAIFVSVPVAPAAETAKAKVKADSKASSKSKPSDSNAAEQAELKKAEALIKTLSSSQKSRLTRLLKSGKKEALIELPGIGEATADHIIKARPLKSSAHLILVKGIGEKTFADIVKSLK